MIETTLELIKQINRLIFPNHFRSFDDNWNKKILSWIENDENSEEMNVDEQINDEKILIIYSSARAKKEILSKIKVNEKYLDLDIFFNNIKPYLVDDKIKELWEYIQDNFSDKRFAICSKYPSLLMEQSDTENELTELAKHKIAAEISVFHNYMFQEKPTGEQISEEKDYGDETYLRLNKNYQYYSELWASSSTREQYFLYDLAQDGIANTKQKAVVLGLLMKGLITLEKERLTLLDSSFRTFILTTIVSNEGKRIDKEMRVRGAWSSIRFILFGIIAASIVFIALGNPGFFDDFNTMLTLVASVVSLFPVVGGLFTLD